MSEFRTYRTRIKDGQVLNEQVRKSPVWGYLGRTVNHTTGVIVQRTYYIREAVGPRLVEMAREWSR